MKPICLLLCVLSLIARLDALVIGDPTNTIINNTSPSASFPWANAGYGNTFSSVYLGNGWVIGSQHTGMPTSFNSFAGGSSYSTVSGSFTPISGADLAVYQLSTIPTSIPDAKLYCDPVAVGDDVIMTGIGFVRDSYNNNGTPGNELDDYYPWSASQQIRWGSNKVSTTNVLNGVGMTIPEVAATIFDEPSNSNYTSSEVQGSIGDSGGGVWIDNGGIWELAGINFAVTDTSDSRAEYGDGTAFTELHSFKNEIYMVTGIPEPSSCLLVIGALSALALRRRR